MRFCGYRQTPLAGFPVPLFNKPLDAPRPQPFLICRCTHFLLNSALYPACTFSPHRHRNRPSTSSQIVSSSCRQILARMGEIIPTWGVPLYGGVVTPILHVPSFQKFVQQLYQPCVLDFAVLPVPPKQCGRCGHKHPLMSPSTNHLARKTPVWPGLTRYGSFCWAESRGAVQKNRFIHGLQY